MTSQIFRQVKIWLKIWQSILAFLGFSANFVCEFTVMVLNFWRSNQVDDSRGQKELQSLVTRDFTAHSHTDTFYGRFLFYLKPQIVTTLSEKSCVVNDKTWSKLLTVLGVLCLPIHLLIRSRTSLHEACLPANVDDLSPPKESEWNEEASTWLETLQHLDIRLTFLTTAFIWNVP